MKIALIFLFLAASCLAAPAPPEIIVNNATMECSMFNAGDECTRCEIPEGWVSLGFGTGQCPEGYAEVTAARNCTPGKNARCCSEGHSGAMGDCGEMAINRQTKQCMFTNATVPAGWEGKTDGEDGPWQCPEGYAWVENAGTCPVASIMAPGLLAVTFVISRRRPRQG
jgi:hypothetical protein